MKSFLGNFYRHLTTFDLSHWYPIIQTRLVWKWLWMTFGQIHILKIVNQKKRKVSKSINNSNPKVFLCVGISKEYCLWEKTLSDFAKRESENFVFGIAYQNWVIASVTSKESPNVYKSCPKMISLEKWKILTPLQKLPKMWTIWSK